jgi:uncharacterized protein DUF6627
MHHNLCKEGLEVIMSMRLGLTRTAVGVSLAALVATGLPSTARAGMISTSEAVTAQAAPERVANLSKVQATLARADVRTRLQALGVDPADAATRAAALPDADLARLANGMDKLPAGGDDSLLAVIGIVFLVLLLLDYLDVIHVFSNHRR